MAQFKTKKLYYSIGEVSRLLGEEQYVLRYWETEFEHLRPRKNRVGNRSYTEKDIAVLQAIKELVRGKQYTMEQAREAMKDFDPVAGTLSPLASVQGDEAHSDYSSESMTYPQTYGALENNYRAALVSLRQRLNKALSVVQEMRRQ